MYRIDAIFASTRRSTPTSSPRALASRAGRVRSTGRPALSYVQVGAINRTEEITPAELATELRGAPADDVAGVALFEYGQLVVDPAKAEIVRASGRLIGRRSPLLRGEG